MLPRKIDRWRETNSKVYLSVFSMLIRVNIFIVNFIIYSLSNRNQFYDGNQSKDKENMLKAIIYYQGYYGIKANTDAQELKNNQECVLLLPLYQKIKVERKRINSMPILSTCFSRQLKSEPRAVELCCVVKKNLISLA